MLKEESNQRIKFAYRLSGWSVGDGSKSLLKDQADKVLPSEYTAEMESEIFCPVCYTNLNRVPKYKDHFSNGRNAYFAHMSKYKEVKCDLRTMRPEGKRYDSYEEAQKAVDDEELVVISGFLWQRPEAPEVPSGEYDETPVEDINGKLTEVTLARHSGESFKLPSRITTVAGICRNFDENIYKYYHFPNSKHAIRLIDLLHDVRDVTKEDEIPRLYFGIIKNIYCLAENPKPHNKRMTELQCSSTVRDFRIKPTIEIAQQKGITETSIGRVVIMYGVVKEDGLGLGIENLNWGEFALLPRKYDGLLIT